MKELPEHLNDDAKAALAIGAIIPLVEYVDRLEAYFPEYAEDDRESFDQYRILVYLFKSFLCAGGEKVLAAQNDIQIELKLGKNAVDNRIKRLKDEGLIKTVPDPEDKDGRRRLLVPTDKTVKRFLMIGLHMLEASKHLMKLAEERCSSLPGYTPSEPFIDPLPAGVAPHLHIEQE